MLRTFKQTNNVNEQVKLLHKYDKNLCVLFLIVGK